VSKKTNPSYRGKVVVSIDAQQGPCRRGPLKAARNADSLQRGWADEDAPPDPAFGEYQPLVRGEVMIRYVLLRVA
jgi:hypothetical protein